jgi:hypothetical protein
MSKILIALSALLLLTLTPSVKADPIAITSGSLTVPGIFRAPQYSFAGQNVSVTGGGGDPGASPSCAPCVSGSLIGMNSLFVGLSLGSGSVTFDGTTFSNVVFGGVFEFTAPSVLIPAVITDISLTSPFTFSGSLFACPVEVGGLNCTPSQQVFSAQFVGQGIATIQLHFVQIFNGNSLFDFRGITYTFTEVPEPMTITLLMAGLMGLGYRLRKKCVRDAGAGD